MSRREVPDWNSGVEREGTRDGVGVGVKAVEGLGDAEGVDIELKQVRTSGSALEWGLSSLLE